MFERCKDSGPDQSGKRQCPVLSVSLRVAVFSSCLLGAEDGVFCPGGSVMDMGTFLTGGPGLPFYGRTSGEGTLSSMVGT